MRIVWAFAFLLILLGGLAVWALIGGGDPPGAVEAPPAGVPAAAPGALDTDFPKEPRTDDLAPPFPASRHALPAFPGLSGRLVQDGRPLPGAEVRACTGSPQEPEAGRCSTTAEGRFSVPLPSGRYRLEVRGKGVPRGFAVQLVVLVEGQHFDCGDLVVPLGAEVAGRVVDPQGLPLPGVRVYGRWESRNPGEFPLGGLAGQEFRFGFMDSAADEADTNVLTGADGRFAIGGFLPGALLVLAEHPERWSGTAQAEAGPGGRGDVGDLVLRPARPLEGFVFDIQGTPVAGATVTPGGGSIEPLRLRHSVLTGADGGFVLREAPIFGPITVEKDGFETLIHEPFGRKHGPLRLTLRPALVLEGRVLGNQGRAGILKLDQDYARPRGWPRWVDRLLAGPHAVAEDGTFRVAGLPEGRWQVGANVPGAGSVPMTSFDLPLREPLLLNLAADRALAVSVVDDLGAPVPHATLARVPPDRFGGTPLRVQPAAQLLSRSDRLEQKADAEGKAVVRIPEWEALQLAAAAPGHLEAAVALEARAVPAAVKIVLARGGVLHGSIADPGLTAHVRATVTCTLQKQGAKQGANMPVDGSGRFRSPPLLPGRYEVRLTLSDATESFDRGVPLPAPVPLLQSRSGAFKPVLDPVPVDIVPGEETEIELPVPSCGEVNGRVLAAGLPVAGAIVYGKDTQKEAESKFTEILEVDPDALDIHQFQPHLLTDAQGRFRFLVGTAGAFELRARHPLGASWSEPVLLHLDRGSRVERDLMLFAAAIRGSLELGGIELQRRGFLRARLCRLEDAGEDPVPSLLGGHSFGPDPVRDRMQEVGLDRTGGFAFECLPPGGYVLRLQDRSDRILLTRVLRTMGGECIDLGRLEPHEGLVPRLGCGLQDGFFVVLHMPVEGCEGVWMRRVFRNRDGEMDWEALLPGRYRLQAFGPSRARGGAIRPAGEPVEVEVHPDGSCTPEAVWPDGIKE